MAETDNDFDDLDLLFAQARQDTGQLPSGLSARILADAERVQDGFSAPPTAQKPGIWAQMLAAIGGLPALGGLAAACAAGVWIGLAPPSFLPDPVQLVTGTGADIDLIDGDELAFAMSEDG